MVITKKSEKNKITFALQGRLDTTSAPEMEETLSALEEDYDELVFDFEELTYISSAGLRVLLSAQKAVNAKGSRMTLMHVNEEIMEVFDMTGFSNFLNIV